MTRKITCKEDLYDTYIENTDENRAAMIAKCIEFDILSEEDVDLYDCNFDCLEVCDYGFGQKLYNAYECELEGTSVEITLEDLLGTAEEITESPRTFKKDGYTYTSINDLNLEDIDLAKMFANGELYKIGGVQITTLKMLNDTDYEGIYTCKKLNWWDTTTFPVLCSVDGYIIDVQGYDESDQAFWSGEGAFDKATPLTKEEIQLYLNNAPE